MKNQANISILAIFAIAVTVGAQAASSKPGTASASVVSQGRAAKPVQHPLLRRAVGKWRVDFEFGLPGQTMKSRGEAVGVSVLNGRFVRISIAAEMMGRKMLHEVTLGHGGFKKHFDFTWLSDQSSATVRATGAVKEKDGVQTLTFRGEMHDAMAGKRPVCHVFVFDPKGTITFTTYDTLPSGKELRVMLMTMIADPRK